jgi:4-aminobutyrate aminotransferase
MTMSLTGQGAWRLGAPQPGIVRAHSASCYSCPFGLTYPACEVRCARDVEGLIRTTTSGRIAGFMAEPVQRVGGFITPPPEYSRIVESIVRKHGGVFISDKVQAGWGRTGGKWFAIERFGVVPGFIAAPNGWATALPSVSRSRSPKWRTPCAD